MLKKSFAVLALGAVAMTAFAGPDDIEWDKSAVVMKMRPGASGAALDAVVGAKELSPVNATGWRSVRLPAGRTIAWAQRYYLAHNTVEAIELRYKYQPTFIPNDPEVTGKQYAPRIVDAYRAWDLTRGSQSTVVSIIDTGIDPTHPEFANGKLLPGYDFSNNDADPTDDLPIEQYANHGTHCAGIAAAGTNNGIGISGIGFNVRVLPVKVFPNSFADVISNAIIYSSDQGAQVISLSLGNFVYSQMMQDAVNYAWSKNRVILAAAGNNNLNIDSIPFYPASYQNVVCVGSTDVNDVKSGFSNFGKRVDVAAPGSAIYSTINAANGGYGYLDGTSMACPAAAGVAALAIAYAPAGTRNSEVVAAMKKTAKPVGNWLSNGRVDAYKTVNEFTLSTPVPATLLTKSVFDGSATTGPGAFINIEARQVRRYGSVAAAVGEYRIPVGTGALRRIDLTCRFAPIQGATAQIYMWNYQTNTYDLLLATPSDSGTITMPLAAIKSQHMGTNGRFRIMSRILMPEKFGQVAQKFTFSVHTMTATFRFSANSA
jgi:thermitase